ncbi:hypothetical protein LTR84_012495 [Exophiala bonariae]|uniref:Dynactin subunit n=1 Tax=Exophiala bonariae TaxID=1690606 RepID=A0AAV9NE69_9EURO|nr:hypothetical protein LTR84_012495 [Exophiala bonariae]
MAISKKYAGLPDLDPAPEVYETPDLADDVSTVQQQQTGTVRTISPTPSNHDSGDPGLDRQPVDREGARRRFGASRVDARDVDFSDAIGASHRSYRTRTSRRRRMIKNDKGEDEVVYMSDSEDETLGRKLARLKREAEEVRLQLQKLDQEKDSDAEFKDSVEEQQQPQRPDQDENVTPDNVDELSKILDGLTVKAGLKGLGTAEEDFISKLDSNARQRQQQRAHDASIISHPTGGQAASLNGALSPVSAVAAFSDRLTALEAALGVGSTSAESSQTTSILPTLNNLSSQITTLFGALNPPTTNTASSGPHTTPLLDSVSSRLKALANESKALEQSRKAALESLARLHETRMHHLVAANIHTGRHSGRGVPNTSVGPDGGVFKVIQTRIEPKDFFPTTDNGRPDYDYMSRPDDESLQITSRVFLEEQATKVTALYQLLPSIQNLQPLLPVVLERLRTLSVIHAGAAEAKNGLDDVEKRQLEMQAEIKQWREAVEVVEKGLAELEESMKGNTKVVGDMVGDLEGRIGTLSSRR